MTTTIQTKPDRYRRLEIALKYYLLGRNYHKALKALNFARGYHTGFRKDKVTPEFQHQVEIALHVTTLKDLIDEESTIIAALLHDLQEDYGVTSEVIDNEFGPIVRDAVWKLTVKFNGYRKNADEYYDDNSQNYISSIVKGCDRVHNVNSMQGVFSDEKRKSYIDEVEKHFLPMLKKAADRFPEQHLAYMNLRHMFKTQIALVRESLDDVED